MQKIANRILLMKSLAKRHDQRLTSLPCLGCPLGGDTDHTPLPNQCHIDHRCETDITGTCFPVPAWLRLQTSKGTSSHSTCGRKLEYNLHPWEKPREEMARARASLAEGGTLQVQCDQLTSQATNSTCRWYLSFCHHGGCETSIGVGEIPPRNWWLRNR